MLRMLFAAGLFNCQAMLAADLSGAAKTAEYYELMRAKASIEAEMAVRDVVSKTMFDLRNMAHEFNRSIEPHGRDDILNAADQAFMIGQQEKEKQDRADLVSLKRIQERLNRLYLGLQVLSRVG